MSSHPTSYSRSCSNCLLFLVPTTHWLSATDSNLTNSPRTLVTTISGKFSV